MKFKFVLALVILTNPLFAQLQPDPSSLTRISFERKLCKRFDDGGVGCSRALLHFSRSTVKEVKGVVDVVFRSPETGKWEDTVRFSPERCEVKRGDWWVCKGVSWRVAP